MLLVVCVRQFRDGLTEGDMSPQWLSPPNWLLRREEIWRIQCVHLHFFMKSVYPSCCCHHSPQQQNSSFFVLPTWTRRQQLSEISRFSTIYWDSEASSLMIWAATRFSDVPMSRQSTLGYPVSMTSVSLTNPPLFYTYICFCFLENSSTIFIMPLRN